MLSLKQRNMVMRIIYIIIGSFIYAVAINALFMPHELLSGGVSGIAMMLEYIFKIPTGISLIVLNIPLFIGGYRLVSKRFTYLSILGIVSSSVFLFITNGWVIPVEDPIIAALFGGLFSGIGTGIVIKNRGSLGGTDIISVIVNKYFSFDIGFINISINSVILAITAILFNVERAMLALVALFVANKSIDAIQEGFNHRKSVIIISDKHLEITEELFKKVKRGITYIDGEGAYTKKQKRLIYMVVTVMEVARIKDIVRRVDPEAFVSIIDTREVEGKGFLMGDIF